MSAYQKKLDRLGKYFANQCVQLIQAKPEIEAHEALLAFLIERGVKTALILITPADDYCKVGILCSSEPECMERLIDALHDFEWSATPVGKYGYDEFIWTVSGPMTNGQPLNLYIDHHFSPDHQLLDYRLPGKPHFSGGHAK